jgi:hypothetical protein
MGPGCVTVSPQRTVPRFVGPDLALLVQRASAFTRTFQGPTPSSGWQSETLTGADARYQEADDCTLGRVQQKRIRISAWTSGHVSHFSASASIHSNSSTVASSVPHPSSFTGRMGRHPKWLVTLLRLFQSGFPLLDPHCD